LHDSSTIDIYTLSLHDALPIYLTVTKLNLFHIEELRTGVFNHRPYNLGWGHHHCNVVVKDSGIDETIQWMNSVIKNNRDKGFITDRKSTRLNSSHVKISYAVFC